jgi:hypothetical protein
MKTFNDAINQIEQIIVEHRSQIGKGEARNKIMKTMDQEDRQSVRDEESGDDSL